MKKISVAIDGPAGAGKSSVAKLVANRLHYLYIDTGAMYRAFTWAMLDRHIDIHDDRAVADLVDTIHIRLEPGPERCMVYVDGQDVTAAIRQPAVSSHVSPVATLAVVRKKLVQLQREMAAAGGVILDGRDIGTVVLPTAELKIYLTASVESRARRRWLEQKEKGGTETLEAIAASIASRDDIDSHRAISPLKQAEDAVLVDNSSLDLDQTAAVIISMIEEKMK